MHPERQNAPKATAGAARGALRAAFRRSSFHSLERFAAMRLGLVLGEQVGCRATTGLLLEIEIGERLGGRAPRYNASAPRGGDAMLTLYSYPELFGVADNNGYGLKVFAALRLCDVPFRHEHILDASSAPRGQLPYITDDGETIGDSDTIITYLIRKYGVTIDAALAGSQRDTDHLVTRMLDDLYWVMSYSRWKDERYCQLSAPRCSRSIRASRKPDCSKRGSSICSAITSKVLVVTRRTPCSREGLQTCRCWQISSRRAATCTGQTPRASTPPFMASSLIFIFTISIHH